MTIGQPLESRAASWYPARWRPPTPSPRRTSSRVSKDSAPETEARMTALWLVAGTSLAAYLLGAIPFGYLIGRWRGVNIFQQGSGNIGATNVGRVLGRRFGILVFFLDFAKGALP